MTTKQLQQQLKDHIGDNKSQFGYVEKGIERLQGDVDKIMDNHLQHIQKDIGDLALSVKGNTENIKWIKKVQWFMVTLSVTTLVGIVVNTYLILKG
jgi:hypothetical protein|tara:strand:- start:3674 stop:3961 length:288 start_codon:yes stop_codon:yes gene_type:complete